MRRKKAVKMTSKIKKSMSAPLLAVRRFIQESQDCKAIISDSIGAFKSFNVLMLGAGSLFLRSQTLKSIQEFTKERNPLNVNMVVANFSRPSQTAKIMREGIEMRGK